MTTKENNWRANRQFWTQKALNLVFANPKVTIGLAIIAPTIVLSIIGSEFTSHGPLETNPADRLQGPSGQYLLGTDHLGRDILSRIFLGARTTLLIGFGSTALAVLLGVPIGLIAGYFKGTTDEILMRIMDIVMSIPTLLLGLLILVALSSSTTNLIMAIGIVFTPRLARVTRSVTLSESKQSYVLAAKARGESHLYIMFREILPNVTSPIVIESSTRVGYAIMVGASLSFLGLGSGPPYPDWGYMVSVAREHMYSSPWILLWPCLALLLVIMATNILGDGLKDALDEKNFQ